MDLFQTQNLLIFFTLTYVRSFLFRFVSKLVCSSLAKWENRFDIFKLLLFNLWVFLNTENTLQVTNDTNCSLCLLFVKAGSQYQYVERGEFFFLYCTSMKSFYLQPPYSWKYTCRKCVLNSTPFPEG